MLGGVTCFTCHQGRTETESDAVKDSPLAAQQDALTCDSRA